MTILEAFPGTKKWCPSWDARSKLNCILTCIGGSPLCDRIKNALEACDGEEPTLKVKKFMMKQVKKWNLIWLGKNRATALEAHEMEEIMGYPKDHTRGITIADRFTFIGSSFQVDTIAYHLSPLKKIFPEGIDVLSLFSGICGAEMALDRLRIRLKTVVAVEKSENRREIVKNWSRTHQTGKLVHFPDVREVDVYVLQGWISEYGKFDLVIGGSPCNTRAGGNRHSREGINGSMSSLFYDYCRTLKMLKPCRDNDSQFIKLFSEVNLHDKLERLGRKCFSSKPVEAPV